MSHINRLKPEFMQAAIEAAHESGRNGDYPIGAVVVRNNVIVSTGYEALKSVNDPVNGHAEIDAIRKACAKLNQPYLADCELYSTHEPCPMCTAASIWAKIPLVAYSVTRDDMIQEMNQQHPDGNFSWRQIAIPAQYIVDHGSPNLELVPEYLHEEGLKLFELTR